MAQEDTGNVGSEDQAAPEATVRVESENGAHEVRIPAVNHLFADIEAFNRQFSMGAMMAGFLISSVHVGDDDKPGIKPVQWDREGSQEEHQLMTASALAVIHKDTLSMLGLTLDPVSGKSAIAFGLGEERVSDGQLRINVSDRNRFVSFLEALEPSQVEETGLKSNLESLSGILAKQVLDNYNLQQPSDEMLQLFGGLGNIIDQYKRLGMTDSVNKLETYLNYARQGDLREYLVVEQWGLLTEPGRNFGPADWHKDGAASRWKSALDVLRMAKNNPKAADLYQQLSEHLLKCIKIARADVKARGVGQPTSDDLEKVHMTMEEMILQ